MDLSIPFRKLVPEAQKPTQANESDAGYDLYAVDSHDIKPGQRVLVKTGISMAIPSGYYGRIAPRSGLAVKNGVDVLAGVVDSGYRGEIGVALINLSDDPNAIFSVRPGMRVAQLIIEKCHSALFVEVYQHLTTERGETGYGQSGA